MKSLFRKRPRILYKVFGNSKTPRRKMIFPVKILPPLKKTGSLLIQVIPFYKGSYNKRILTKNHNEKRANSDSSIKTKD